MVFFKGFSYGLLWTWQWMGGESLRRRGGGMGKGRGFVFSIELKLSSGNSKNEFLDEGFENFQNPFLFSVILSTITENQLRLSLPSHQKYSQTR